MATPRVALVHDWMVSPGGAERMLYQIHQIWPDAPIYTAAYVPEKFPEFVDVDVRPTWLDRIPLAKTKHQLFPVLRGWAFKSLDLSNYDIVISSCSAESKYVRTGRNTLHICYCHTPIRYYWSDYNWYVAHPPFGKLNWLARGILPFMIGWLRHVDYQAAQKVSVYVANSKFIQQRIEKYYGKPSTVIYPPIETAALLEQPRESGDYYLIVGRQVAYKRLDLAVEAFNQLGLPLKVVGGGEEIERQKPLALDNIEFLGRVSDEERNRLMAGAKGFIWPQVEDFGMTAIEAMAAGTPVIAYAAGGSLEYVIEGISGTLFREQTSAGLVEAVHRFETLLFDQHKVREVAKRFDETVFRSALKAFVDKEWQAFPGKRNE